MAKDLSIIFIFFFSISGILFYKWLAIYKKVKNMTKINCKVTNIKHVTAYDGDFSSYYYEYKINNKIYTAYDNITFSFFWKKHINDNLIMYVSTKMPKEYISPWQTYLYKLYLHIIVISLLIPFVIFILT